MLRGVFVAAVLGALSLMSNIVLAQDVCGPGSDRALVLSGGGTKGAYEAAAAYHLIVHRNCDFKDFAGVSAGGLNVSYLAQAPVGPDSLKNLQAQAVALLKLWRSITDSSAFMTPRFLGKLRMLFFGLESLNDFSPLKELIRKNIEVQKLRASGRKVRVGYVSFYDGGYREIGPDSECLHRDEKDQYLEYVFASALIPIFGEMPLIRQPHDGKDPATWTQFADGGVRHTTPISGYFPNSEVFTMRFDGGGAVVPDPEPWRSGSAPKDPCGAAKLPPHEKPIQDLFIVVASPYKKLDDRVDRLKCDNQPCSQTHDGQEIALRTIWTTLESPYRWDVNYGITANNMLKWLNDLIRVLPAGDPRLAEIRVQFPVSSFNGERIPRPYRHMPIITPSASLTEETYEVTTRTMLKQLSAGCRDANEAMEKLGGVPMRGACEAEFPDPAIETGSSQ